MVEISLESVTLLADSKFEFCSLFASRTKFFKIANESLILVKVKVPEKLHKNKINSIIKKLLFYEN